jgi:Predicted transcriptional regulators
MNAKQRRLYRMKAEILAAAGHPFRLAILDFLCGGEQCVCDIATYLGAGRSNISRHLSVLRKAGLIRQRKEGLKVLYKLRSPAVRNLDKCAANVLRRRIRETSAILDEL